MSLPQQSVQSCHSCIEASNAFHFNKLNEHPSVIILGIKSEAKLNNVKIYLNNIGVKFISFHEPDRNNELTSIATEPVFQENRNLFKKFQLIKERRVSEPSSKKTQYAAKFPDGYFKWQGESRHFEVIHRTSDIGFADMFDSEQEAKTQTKATEIEKVEIQYYIGGAK